MIQFALRNLRSQPLPAMLIVVSLALGFGVNISLFSLADTLLFRSIPGVQDPEQIVAIFGFKEARPDELRPMSYADYIDYSEGLKGLVDLAAFADRDLLLAEGEISRRVRATVVTEGYFSVLGVGAARGRLLDFQEGLGDAVVLSHRMWKERFQEDPSVLGRPIVLNGRPLTVIGVTSPGFAGSHRLSQPDLWISLPTYSEISAGPVARVFETLDRKQPWFSVLGRVKTGTPLEQAQTALTSIAKRLQQTYSDINKERGARAVPFSEVAFGPRKKDLVSRYLVILGGLSLLVLAIVGFNVSSLLILRGLAHQRKIAIRAALGAQRHRLMALLMGECLLLTLLGTSLGFALAWLGQPLVRSLQLPIPVASTIVLDGRTVLFAVLVCLLATAAFGLLPALRYSRPRLVALLHSSPAPSRRRFALPLREAVVVAQLGLTALVALTATLFVRTLWNLEAIDPGFRPEGILSAPLDLGQANYNAAQALQLHEDLRNRLQGEPSVEGIAFAGSLPVVGASLAVTLTLTVENYLPIGGEQVAAHHAVVDAGFFDLLGIPIRQGRDFRPEDATGPGVLLINESMADRYWPSGNAVGGRVWLSNAGELPFQVIGIVEDGAYGSLRKGPAPALYVYYKQQNPEWLTQIVIPGMALLVRTSGPPQNLTASIRRAIAEIDTTLPLADIAPLTEKISEGYRIEWQAATLTVLGGFLALLLSGVVLFGTLSYLVQQRRREIAIRSALGGRSTEIFARILRRSLLLATLGLTLGGVAFTLTRRLLSERLYGVTDSDPASIAAMVVVILSVALVAGFFPAWKAARTEPATILSDN